MSAATGFVWDWVWTKNRRLPFLLQSCASAPFLSEREREWVSLLSLQREKGKEVESSVACEGHSAKLTFLLTLFSHNRSLVIFLSLSPSLVSTCLIVHPPHTSFHRSSSHHLSTNNKGKWQFFSSQFTILFLSCYWSNGSNEGMLSFLPSES